MSASSPLTSKENPMKRTSIRKRKKKRHTRRNLFFNKVVSYLLSHSYLYNPLVSPQPTFDFPPPKLISTFPVGEQGDVALPIRGSSKIWLQNEFLVHRQMPTHHLKCLLLLSMILNSKKYCLLLPNIIHGSWLLPLWGLR
ncbi:hypothetical protein L2E82_22416 [Cichorium intybus]|uniref:Uncharacterized protein n=1 Tax=Cichorium intybus TaxID=13427 RepID=A0ACB9DYC0_CICIN|nr:hypothetical protein L2E82_22416 [Cichorium intybus]